MKVDFSAFLDLTAPPPQSKPIEVKPLDQGKYKKAKTGGIKFEYGIGDPKEFSAESTVVVTEVVYRANTVTILEDSDIEKWLLQGSPMY